MGNHEHEYLFCASGALLLLNQGADPNGRETGLTPLMIAVDLISKECEKELSAPASATTSAGHNLMLPLNQSWHSIMALLLQQPRIDVAAADLQGRTALHRLFDMNSGPACERPPQWDRHPETRAEILGMMLSPANLSIARAVVACILGSRDSNKQTPADLLCGVGSEMLSPLWRNVRDILSQANSAVTASIADSLVVHVDAQVADDLAKSLSSLCGRRHRFGLSVHPGPAQQVGSFFREHEVPAVRTASMPAGISSLEPIQPLGSLRLAGLNEEATLPLDLVYISHSVPASANILASAFHEHRWECPCSVRRTFRFFFIAKHFEDCEMVVVTFTRDFSRFLAF